MSLFDVLLAVLIGSYTLLKSCTLSLVGKFLIEVNLFVFVIL